MLDCSLVSLKIPWLRGVATMAPCSQLVAKTKKTPFYGPLTSGFAVHCVYSGLPISHGNRPNVPKPTRKNNFRRVQLPSAPTKDHRNSDRITVVFCWRKALADHYWHGDRPRRWADDLQVPRRNGDRCISPQKHKGRRFCCLRPFHFLCFTRSSRNRLYRV